MRNFYKTLQVSSFSDSEIIRRVLKKAKFSPEIEAILLDTKRRRIYDRAWNCLSVISQLRANLDLNRTVHWKKNHSDFTIDNDGYLPLISQLVELAKAPQRNSESAEKNESVKKEEVLLTEKVQGGGKATIWAVCLLLGVIWMVNSCPKKREIPATAYPPIQNTQTSASYDDGGSRSASPSTRIKTSTPTPPLKPKARPNTGRLTGKGKNVAPFSIKTQIGRDYYIKLESVDTLKTVMTAYIRGGDTFKTKVPTGSYILKYASGAQWYGTKDYFGNDTVFSKADEVFFFRRTSDGYEGYTVELILQKYGNLHTSGISKNNF